MNDVSQAGGWRAAPRWMKIVFALSLLANFIFVGIAAGAAYKAREWRGKIGSAHSVSHMIRAMPEERRDAARALFDANKDKLRQARRERWQAQERLGDSIAASPYDADVVIAAMAAVREADTAFQSEMHALFSDLLSTMSDEERRDMIEHARSQRKKWRRGRENGRDGQKSD